MSYSEKLLSYIFKYFSYIGQYFSFTGKVHSSLLIVVVSIASCTLAQDCSLAYNFFGQIREQINEIKSLTAFAKQIGVSAALTPNFQRVLYDNYRMSGFLQIDDITFGECSSQFDSLIYYGLVLSEILPNNS